MIEIKKLKDNELIRSADEAVAVEKEAVTNTTRHFQEILARRSFLPEYTNMFELLTRRWGYCNGSAQLRIGALHLIQQVPAVQAKIESGEMSMTVAASIQTFLNREKTLKRPYSQNAKIELVDACTGMSKLEAQKEFVRRNPELEKHESFRFTSPDRVRLDVSISAKTFEQINELRDIRSHTKDAKTIGELIERIVEEAHDKYSPARNAERAKQRSERKKSKSNVAIGKTKHKTSLTADGTSDGGKNLLGEQAASAELLQPDEVNGSATRQTVEAAGAELLHPDEVTASSSEWADEGGGAKALDSDKGTSIVNHRQKRTRYIRASERAKVSYDGHGCVLVDGVSGRRCRSKRFLQLDHIEPFAQGGANIAENLRWVCGAHNRWRSEADLH